MIKVTVGEQQTQKEIPFPKLMKINYGSRWIGYFVEYGRCLWIEGPHAGVLVENVNMTGINDYNEPVTLQNELP